MARELFVDASAWVALADKKDNHHVAATQIYPHVLSHYQRFVTTDLVIAEAYVIVRHDLGHSPAIQFLDGLARGLRILRVFSSEELEIPAKEILRKYDDQDFSYTDAVSFALMKQRGMTDVFTYDEHFRMMGFRIVK